MMAREAGGGVLRRQLLRGAAAVGAVLGVGPVAAVAHSAEAAGTTRSASLPTIKFMYNWQGPWNNAAGQLVAEALRNLEPKVGARIVPLINGCCGGGAGYIIPQILAGDGPDVYTGCCEDFAGFVNQGMLLNLAPYIKRDNIDSKVWSSGQYAGFTLPNGQYALPVYAGPHVLMYNQTALDELGLEYPDDTWDYNDAAKLWRALSGTFNGQQRVGAQLSWFNGFWEGPYLLKGWGGEEMNASHTRCVADSPPSTAALTWLYDQIDAGVVGTRDLSISPWPLGPQTVFVTLWGGTITSTASALRTSGGKYRYIPYPKWPVRHASDMNIDFYGINGFTKYPEEAWRLLTEISGPGTYYQRTVQMRLALTPPCLNSLWEEFLSIAYTVAPPLRGTNLEAMMNTALNGWGYTQQYYQYEAVQADGILASYLTKIAGRTMSPADAMRLAANQVNALEVSGAATSANSARELAAIEGFAAKAVTTTSALTTPPASRTGAGAGPVSDGSQVKVKSGTWTVTGGGSGVHGSTDGLTFAGTQSDVSRATYICRITGIHAVKPATSVNNGAKIGLMIRADLSDQSPSVGLEVAMGRGIHYHTQPFAGFNMGDQHAGVTAGLLQASGLLANNSQPAANYLLRPVWLKLIRDGITFSGYTSLDGRTWAPAGHPGGVALLGAWIGLYVTAKGNGDLVSATFDNVQGFEPNTFVRLGTP